MADGPSPCGPGCGCVNTFSTKTAEADLERYRRHGVEGATKALVEAIKARGIDGATLLDVGGGIGAIQLELLAAGLAASTSVDATEAYVDVAADEAARRGFADRTSHRFGTLVGLASELGPSDIVTLDKVICCDPDLPALLDAVTAKAQRIVGLVYPRVTWWNRIASRALAVWGRLTRDTTRWYLHRDADVDGRLRAAGFVGQEVERTLIWHVVIYARPS